MKTIRLTESQVEGIIKKILSEQPEMESKGKKKDKKARCVPENSGYESAAPRQQQLFARGQAGREQ
jgi:hypothetical protein